MTSESRASTAKSSLTYHRIIEAFKFGYSWRARLGDPAFVSGMSEVGKIRTDVNAMYSSVFSSFLCRLSHSSEIEPVGGFLSKFTDWLFKLWNLILEIKSRGPHIYSFKSRSNLYISNDSLKYQYDEYML